MPRECAKTGIMFCVLTSSISMQFPRHYYLEIGGQPHTEQAIILCANCIVCGNGDLSAHRLRFQVKTFAMFFDTYLKVTI